MQTFIVNKLCICWSK